MNIFFEKEDRLWLFFSVVYLLSWIIWIPLIFFQNVEALQSNGTLLFSIGVTIPSLAGILFTYRYKGKKETKELLKRGIKGFKIVWVIIILLLIPFLAITSLGLTAVITGSVNLLTDIPRGLIAFVNFPFILVIGGPLIEEYGWRGFALDRLQSKWNGTTSSIILGIMWGFWHIPAFFISGTSQNILLEYLPLSAGLFFIQIIFISIIMTWLYNNTERSILGSILFHTIWNTTFGGFFIAVLTGFINDPATFASNTEVLNTINLGNLILTGLLFIVCLIIIYKQGYNLDKTTHV
jgi:hypothetical protein